MSEGRELADDSDFTTEREHIDSQMDILTDIPAMWSLPAMGCWRRIRWTAEFTWQESFNKSSTEQGSDPT